MHAWIVSDGQVGNEKQALALASAIGVTHEIVPFEPRAPWRWFAPHMVQGATHAFGGALGQRVHGELPSLAMGCGRQAALALRVLRMQSGSRCRTIQILDPRIDPRAFDLVVVPAHDALRGDNVIVSRGGLHGIDAACLARARLEWARFGTLPAPRTVVLLGGSNRSMKLNEAYWRQLANKLGHWLSRDGGSLRHSTSRRSPDWLRGAARSEYSAVPGLQWHGIEDGPNPYVGMLAWADRIVVTPDSINLLSEACATAAPVLCHFDKPLQGKHADFYRDLLEAGRVRPMKLEYGAWKAEPLRDVDGVAAQVKSRLVLAE
jgi:mitochondrial fission protein ELM1